MHVRPTLKPIYQTPSARYIIDRCEPQLRAIQAGKIQFHALTNGHYPGDAIDTGALPGLNSIGYWDAIGPQDWGLDPHRNEGIEIVFMETGGMIFTVDNRRQELRAGHFTVTRPWQLHKLGGPNIGPGRLHWLIIDVGVRRPNQEWHWPKWVSLTKADLAQLTRKLRHNENPVWGATPEIAHAFRSLARTVTRPGEPHNYSRMIIQLNHLLLGILDALTEQQKYENPELTSRRRTVELFLRDLSQNPASLGELWTLEGMARHCGMGVTAFSKYSREVVNVGPVEYLNQCRLDQAARQLREKPAKAVTDIAMENGFNSSQYFATRFRQRFHCSPREYREQNR